MNHQNTDPPFFHKLIFQITPTPKRSSSNFPSTQHPSDCLHPDSYPLKKTYPSLTPPKISTNLKPLIFKVTKSVQC